MEVGTRAPMSRVRGRKRRRARTVLGRGIRTRAQYISAQEPGSFVSATSPCLPHSVRCAAAMLLTVAPLRCRLLAQHLPHCTAHTHTRLACQFAPGSQSAAADTRRFSLMRMDDNANIALIRTFDSEQEALAELRVLEERGHKQTYWVQEEEQRTAELRHPHVAEDRSSEPSGSQGGE